MRIGVVSDIHANRQALDAILDDFPSVDRLVCAGDIVGYGGDPAYCVRRIREECDVVVRGNHDRCLTSSDNYPNPVVAASHRHARTQLDHDDFRWLQNLPYQSRLEGYVVVHSHPSSPETHVLPPDAEELVRHVDADGIVYGHTHIPCNRHINGVHVVNPGSVGQPRDGNAQASYAVIESGNAEVHRVQYDIEAASMAIRNAGIPADAADRLRRGN